VAAVSYVQISKLLTSWCHRFPGEIPCSRVGIAVKERRIGLICMKDKNSQNTAK
jgi:hypothetical protein